MEDIDFSNNGFTGTLPDCFSQCENMWSFWASSNYIEGRYVIIVDLQSYFLFYFYLLE